MKSQTAHRRKVLLTKVKTDVLWHISAELTKAGMALEDLEDWDLLKDAQEMQKKLDSICVKIDNRLEGKLYYK